MPSWMDCSENSIVSPCSHRLAEEVLFEGQLLRCLPPHVPRLSIAPPQAPHVMVENYKLPKVRRLRQESSILCAGENLSTCQGKDGKLDFDAAHSFAV